MDSLDTSVASSPVDTASIGAPDFSPSSANPQANSWESVLQYGLARYIDAKTAPTPPQPTPSINAKPSVVQSLTGGNAWIAWGLLGLVVVAVIFEARKG